MIEYQRVKESIVTDVLSRREGDLNGTGWEENKLSAISQPIPNYLEVIKYETKSNSKLQNVIQRIQNGEAIGP